MLFVPLQAIILKISIASKNKEIKNFFMTMINSVLKNKISENGYDIKEPGC
jgi:hypothetical protein